MSTHLDDPYLLTSVKSLSNDTNGTDSILPGHLEIAAFSVPVYGFISPIVILLTVVTNALVCAVLLRRHMRNATNTILLAMALSDTLCGLCPLPGLVYFFSLGACHDWIPYDWCVPLQLLFGYLPSVFHTTSIWLTVLLALQRYVAVRHPQTAKRLCTVANVVRAVISVYLAAGVSHVICFSHYYVAVEVPSLVNETVMVLGCDAVDRAFLQDSINIYYNVYHWFVTIFIHFIPCCVLVVLNGILFKTIRQAQRRRRQLLSQNRKRESYHLKESSSTTTMLVIVVAVFLLVEGPLAMTVIAVHVLQLSWYLDVVLSLLINVLVLLTYPVNLFIYCAMSRQFRVTFKNLFYIKFGSGTSTSASDTAETRT